MKPGSILRHVSAWGMLLLPVVLFAQIRAERWDGVAGPTMGYALQQGAGVRVLHGLPGSAHWGELVPGTEKGRAVAGDYLLQDAGELIYLPTMQRIGDRNWAKLSTNAEGALAAALDESGTQLLLVNRGEAREVLELPGRVTQVAVLASGAAVLASQAGLWQIAADGKLVAEAGLAGISALQAAGETALISAGGLFAYSSAGLQQIGGNEEELLAAAPRQFVTRDSDGQLSLWRLSAEGQWSKAALPISGKQLRALSVWKGRALLLEGSQELPAWFLHLDATEGKEINEMVTQVPPIKMQKEGGR